MTDRDLETESGRREALIDMLRIRRFEERTGELFSDNEIPGFVHLYIGQEAVAVGATSALDEDDYITSTHRGHGHCIAMGLGLDGMYAELFGKKAGFNNGKGGSMHIADVDAGMLGANGIVGSGAPIATGAGLTKAVKEESGIAVAFYGDGGVSQGQVHEAITLGALWDLPVVYLIEANQYAEDMSVEEVFNSAEYADFGEGYDIPGVTVDGMDVEAVYRTVSEAKERAEARGGPTIVAAETYRYREHAEGTGDSRPEDEVARWRDRDPVTSFKQRLIEAGELTETEFDRIDERIASEIDDAVEYAREAAQPSPEDAYEDVFVEEVPDIEYHRRRLQGD